MKSQEGGGGGQTQNVITRTRQDLINTGELFRINGKVAVQQDEIRTTPASSKMSFDGNRKILLRDCCFIFANLTLVVATVIALIVLYRFFQDEPLADYYDYLLTLRFYWQMIFVTCLMPLILLVPVLALLHRLLTASSNSKPVSPGRRLALKAKLFYQVLIWLLALLALIFVAPFIRSTTLQSQIKLELDKFMRRRYENEFAYRLLDDIQSRYECCDHLWYRANLRDQLPLSCFVRETNFSVYFDRTCSETLSSIVGLRCYLLAGCLIVILIALACLSSIDLNHLLADSSDDRRHYEISSSNSSGSGSRGGTPTGLGTTAATAAKAAMTSTEFDRLVRRNEADSGCKTAANNRYEPHEHEGSRPLLEEQNRSPVVKERFSQLGEFDSLPEAKIDASEEPILLTRANYQNIKRERSQSPVFVPSSFQPSEITDLRAKPFDERRDSPGELARPTIKSVLKKTTSNSSSTIVDQPDGPNPPTQFGSLDRDETEFHLEQRRRRQAPLGQFEYDSDEVDDNDDDDDDENDYTDRLRSQSDTLLRQKQLFQREQTRRSLLSVRFADETDT